MQLPSTPGIRPIQQMLPPISVRNRTPAMLTALAIIGLAAVAPLHAQEPATNAPSSLLARRPGRFSTLPPTQPTSLPVAVTPPAANALSAPLTATPISTAQPVTRPHRAEVSFVNSQLDVRASDSSLNQILRAISRETGLKITGGVADQRVFGNYGPAPMASILATLLDGTGTNILLLEGDAQTPPELILTVRGSGPTPPNPDAPGFDDGPETSSTTADQAPTERQAPMQATRFSAVPQRQIQPPSAPPANNTTDTTTGPRSMPQPENDVNGSSSSTSPSASTYPTTNSVPTDSLPTPSTTPPTAGIVDTPNPPAAGSTTGTDPNGSAITPEQIYQKLLQMQKQQVPAPPATPVSPQQ